MFKLITAEDVVQIPPHLFGYPRSAAIEHVLNKRLSDRVLPGHGLLIGVWDILSALDDRLVRTTGTTSTRVCFRLVVFAPFAGEAILTRVAGATDAGLLAHLHFFDAVWVRRERLPRPAVFEPKDKVWTWRPTFDAADEPSEFFMDVNNESVVRVTHVEYDSARDTKVRPPRADVVAAPAPAANAMTVYASLFDDVYEDNQGLGDPAWWFEGDAEDEDGAEDEEGEAEAGADDGDGVGDALDDGEKGDGEYGEDEPGDFETEYVANESGAAVEDENSD